MAKLSLENLGCILREGINVAQHIIQHNMVRRAKSEKADPYKITVKGISYSFTSEVWERTGTRGGDDSVEAVVYIDTARSVPIGYMGGQAFLYDDNGTLKTASSMEYNDSEVAGWTGYSPRIITPGRYYAQSDWI